MYKRPLILNIICNDINRPLENLINEASLKLSLTPSDDFLELMDKYDFTRRGRMSWSLSTRTAGRSLAPFFKEYLEDFLPATMVQTDTKLAVDAPYTRYNYENIIDANFRDSIRHELERIPEYVKPKLAPRPAQFIKDVQEFGRSAARRQAILNKHATLGGVHVEIVNDQLWVRAFPIVALEEWSSKDNVHRIHLPKTRNVKYSVETFFPPRKINSFIEEIRKTWGDCFAAPENEAVVDLLEKAHDVVTVGYSPNQPATVLLTVGSNVKTSRGFLRASGLDKYKPNVENKVSLTTALRLQETNPKVEFLIHPALDDIVRMSKAKPYTRDARLKDYQQIAVGLHLSTRIGYLQSCAPGLGKTVIQLAGMRARSQKIENYRGLVVCEANVREQWSEETAKWFPEAKVTVIRTQNDVDDLIETLSFEGPSVVIMSYAHTLLAHAENESRVDFEEKLRVMTYAQKLKTMREAPMPDFTIGNVILDSKWNDICADEAVSIRNGSSKQFSVMWTLRQNAEVASALTASPINKSPDDIGRLISWVRNDRNMFTGAPLSQQYDTQTEEGALQLFKVFGPLVFRRDTSEISHELPTVVPTVHLITPNAGEKALAFAAENELKRCYFELVAALDQAEKAGTGDKEELAKVKANLVSARGAWLGGTQLARMATSDPTALLYSESVGAALLAGQGLIEGALVDEPTKRKKFVEDMLVRVGNGQQVVAFTAFATVAGTLVQALQDNGINAQAYTGKNGATRDRARKDFQDGKVDVLVCTKAAERGLTLHKASAIYHYDLPWVPDEVIQRTGRGVRIGSENANVDVVFLVMKDTIEYRIAGRLSELGMSASLILDHSRGVDVKKTEMATAMGGLMTAMASGSNNKNLSHFAELLGIKA